MRLSGMDIDPKNPIVMLCLEGMRAEGSGKHDDARLLFVEAWERSSSDYEACIAAHYLARQQQSSESKLYWNQEALRRAEAAGDELVRDFYPSLHLNVADALEEMGEHDSARSHYRRAREWLARVPEEIYGEHVHTSIHKAIERLATR